jgi:hypothetical protein
MSRRPHRVVSGTASPSRRALAFGTRGKKELRGRLPGPKTDGGVGTNKVSMVPLPIFLAKNPATKVEDVRVQAVVSFPGQRRRRKDLSATRRLHTLHANGRAEESCRVLHAEEDLQNYVLRERHGGAA